LKQVNTNLF